jgi:hypothetical protein
MAASAYRDPKGNPVVVRFGACYGAEDVRKNTLLQRLLEARLVVLPKVPHYINVNVGHFLNYTWVSRLVDAKATPVTEEALFAGHWAAHGKD